MAVLAFLKISAIGHEQSCPFYVSEELNRWKSLALSSKKRIFATENRVLTQKNVIKLCILSVKHT